MFKPISDTHFEIPTRSFTAYKLTYSDIEYIHKTSRCIFIGDIPKCWFKKNNSDKVNKTKIAADIIQGTLKSISSSKSSQTIDKPNTISKTFKVDTGFLNIYDRTHDFADLSNEFITPGMDFWSDDSDIDDEFEGHPTNDVANVKSDNLADLPNLNSGDSSGMATTSVSISDSFQLKQVPHEATASINSKFESSDSESNNEQSQSNSNLNSNNLINSSSFTQTSPNESTESVDSNSLNVRFVEPNKFPSMRQSTIDVVTTNPTEYVGTGNKIMYDKEHNKKILQRLKQSSKKFTGKRHKVKKKVMKNFLRRFGDGEVLKMDHILVLILKSDQLWESKFDENSSLPTNVYETWKNYLVVLRKNESYETQLELQFFKHSTDEKDLKKPQVSFEISSRVLVNFYSSLDKTISINVPNEDGGSFFYILQCHNALVSFQWLFILQQGLSYPIDEQFSINIPALDLSVNINVPKQLLTNMFQVSPWSTVEKLEKGYRLQFSGIVQFLREKIYNKLTRFPNFKWKIESIGVPWLCFKYYDRLEWVINNNAVLFLQNVLRDDLELQLVHKPISSGSVELSNGTIMEEPIPIEGFLARLTDTHGCTNEFILFQEVYKLQYFYTCDQNLFFTGYSKSLPPITEIDSMKNDNQISEQCRLIETYPLDGNKHVPWMNEKDFEKGDRHAESEFTRKVHQIIKAEGVIDICQIKNIVKVPYKKITLHQKTMMSTLWHGNLTFVKNQEVADAVFEIEMIHGSILRLQAPNCEVRDEWMNRLWELKNYWCKKNFEHTQIMMTVRDQNTDHLNLTEYVDSNITQEANKVELDHSFANPQIYNLDALALSKPVIMSGYIYIKSKIHSDFTQRYVVLCPGFLMLFKINKRSSLSGVNRGVSLFEHLVTIPINGTYIYSGEITSGSLIKRSTEFNSQNPGRHQLPRIYIDGWRSCEEEYSKCFNLWIGKKRDLREVDKKIENVIQQNSHHEKIQLPKNPGIVRLVKKLGFTGKTMIFMCRSRQDREIWVSRIQTEINRFAKLDKFNV